MKKTIISILLLAIPVVLFAQLKVLSDGHVSVGVNNGFANTKLFVGDSTITNHLSAYDKSLFTLTEANAQYSVGQLSIITPPSDGVQRTCVLGQMGLVTPYCANRAIAIHGWLTPSNNGVAVYGSTGIPFALENNARYAGFFDGDARVTGTLTTPDLVTPSDIRLKENIVSLRDMHSEATALNNILNMNVIQYNYIKRQTGEEDMLGVEGVDINSYVESENDRMAAQKHYGLSAQELQKIYPDLVREGQDGFLGINYVELVPILIRSIQELKAELDDVKEKSSNARQTRSAFSGGDEEFTEAASRNILYQNTPNPFKEQTVIRFSLADNAQNAAICIFDMTGKMLKKLPISSGDTSVKINGWELGEGMFLYTLIVNGREIDTKRMIITR